MDSMYFVQRRDGGWDEVDEYIFANSDKVIVHREEITDDEEVRTVEHLRYTSNKFAVVDGRVHLAIEDLTVNELGKIARLAGATIPSGSVNGGIATWPEGLLMVKERRWLYHYDVRTGSKFRKVA